MPRTIVTRTKVYKYKELNEKAKEMARDWYRGHLNDDEWWEYVYTDAENIGLHINGFSLEENTINSELTKDAEQVCKIIFAEHGEQCDTYQFALKWTAQFITGDHDDTDFRRRLQSIYLKHLDAEWTYINSNESIADNIECNEYEFTQDGKRYRE